MFPLWDARRLAANEFGIGYGPFGIGLPLVGFNLGVETGQLLDRRRGASYSLAAQKEPVIRTSMDSGLFVIRCVGRQLLDD
jgi:hypothetical protein